MNPREDLTGCTAPGPVTLRLSMPVSSPGTEASEKINPRLNIIIYVLKPVCVYSRDALLTIIYHLGIIYNFKFNSKTRQVKLGFSPPGDRFEVRALGHVQIWPETPVRLQAVQNVLASVVDIGAKTDYDNTETRMLRRACCHGGPSRFAKRTVLSFRVLAAFYQCHINLI